MDHIALSKYINNVQSLRFTGFVAMENVSVFVTVVFSCEVDCSVPTVSVLRTIVSAAMLAIKSSNYFYFRYFCTLRFTFYSNICILQYTFTFTNVIYVYLLL